MATLTANISTSATILGVSEEVENGFYTIDDEAIYVHGTSRGAQGRAFDRKRVTVDRAIAGTTAATHLSGAELTRYYPDSASATGGGGVTVDPGDDTPVPVESFVIPGAVIEGTEADLSALAGVQTISLLGPYNVTFETPDIFTNGVLLDTLAAGTIVISAWAEGIAGFIGGTVTDPNIEIWIGNQSEFSGYPIYTARAEGANNTAQFVTAWPPSVVGIVPDAAVQTVQARIKTTTDLYMWVDLTGSGPTQGEADIYVLIGTPA